MSDMSDYLEQAVYDHIFRNTAIFSTPSTIYIAACTSAPTDASTGSNIVEPVGGSYARASVTTTGGTAFTAHGAGGPGDNASTITFATATGNWGTITHIAICSALTLGNMWFWRQLAASKTINSGDTLKINTGDLDITFQ